MRMFFEAIAIKENVGYAADYSANGLFKVDMQKMECEFILGFNEETAANNRLFSKAIWIEDEIVFIPASANSIYTYNVQKKTLVNIPIPEPERKKYAFYNRNMKFIDAVQKDNYIWLFPSTYPGIVRINIIDNSLTVFDDCVPAKGYLFRSNVFIKGDKSYIPDGKSNMVLIFDLEECEATFVNIGDNNNGVMKTCVMNDIVFFAPRLNGSIVSWNIETGEVIEYSKYPYGFVGGKFLFSNCLVINNQIVFSPANSNRGLVLKNGELSIEESFDWKLQDINKLEYLFQTEGLFYYREYLSDGDNRMFMINEKDGRLTEVDFNLIDDEGYKTKIINEAALKNDIIKEGCDIQLKDFLSAIRIGG